MPTPLTGWSPIMPAAACQILSRPDSASFKPARSPLRAAMLRSTRLPNCAEKLKASAAAMVTLTSMLASKRLRPIRCQPLSSSTSAYTSQAARAPASRITMPKTRATNIQPFARNFSKAASSANGESVASTNPSF